MSELKRTTFETSRAAEYFDAREPQAQTGQPSSNFAVVALKELADNALDAVEIGRGQESRDREIQGCERPTKARQMREIYLARFYRPWDDSVVAELPLLSPRLLWTNLVQRRQETGRFLSPSPQ